MKHYIEITLLPNPDIALNFLWEKVYQRIHLGLVEIKDHKGNVPIGIAFPEYNAAQYQLGTKLRLFAQEAGILEQLNPRECLKHLSDYVHLTTSREVPENKITGYVSYSRVQVKSNAQRLMRRSIKKGKLSQQQAEEALSKLSDKQTTLPFVQINSKSTGERFPLFIDCIEQSQANTKTFNTYGLSKQSTVPVF